MFTLRVGTRSSALAMLQTRTIVGLLEQKIPGLDIEIVEIKTAGDKILDRPISNIGSTGVFTKEIERALLDKKIDIAVHSLKDLESVLPEGLMLGAVPLKEDPRDALIGKDVSAIGELKQRAKVLTGSLRRRAQLLFKRNDLIVEDVRGNVETRLRKFEESDADALILASAGLKRLGLENRISGFIPVAEMLPAVGQGAIGIEIRENDDEVNKICESINDEHFYATATAERSFLKTISGGCTLPVGCFGELDGEEILLHGIIASGDGMTAIKRTMCGSKNDPHGLGKILAEIILSAGGKEIIDQLEL